MSLVTDDSLACEEDCTSSTAIAKLLVTNDSLACEEDCASSTARAMSAPPEATEPNLIPGVAVVDRLILANASLRLDD